ncbi:MAG: RNA-directed DNA polymerase [Proteobacteria bacterium]|nr:RNA-directed DNA polymerase [Pseudomonadota bacterium]
MLATKSRRLKRFLEAGYLPKELPPVFVSSTFARNRKSLLAAWPNAHLDQWKSVPEPFSIPKAGHSRRTLSLLNPISHYKVAEIIAAEWTSIKRHIRTSRFTEFSPIIDFLGDRALVPPNHLELDKRRARIRAAHPRALYSDILRFYPSIYTHSIPWAMHGKAWAKQNLNSAALRNSIGGRLDRAIRQAQDNQTIGIPIGPDTSRVVAELIAVAVDVRLAADLPSAYGVRYVDDYFIGVKSGQSDDAVASLLGTALRHFELDINSAKTSSDDAGQGERPSWARRIQTVEFRHYRAELSLRDYFDEVVSLYCDGRQDAVVKYGVKRSRLFAIPEPAIPYYIDRLTHLARICPASLPAAVQTILDRASRNRAIDYSHLRSFIVELISEMAPLQRAFEVVWLLFLARGLGLTLRRDELDPVFKMDSSPCALLVMDLDRIGLVDGGVEQRHWLSCANNDGLAGPMWLLAYEAERKGWWDPAPNSYVSTHPLFGPMLARGISFYEERRNVRTTQAELLSLLLSRRRYNALFNDLEDYL